MDYATSLAAQSGSIRGGATSCRPRAEPGHRGGLAGALHPPARGREGRHRHLGRWGCLEIYAFDPLSTALAKIARGHPADFADIRALVEAGQVDGPGLARALAEILPRVAAGEAALITAEAFGAHLREFLTASGSPSHAPPGTVRAPGGGADPVPPLVGAFRSAVGRLRTAHPTLPPEDLDATALREVALTHPTAARNELRLALGAGSAAVASAAVGEAARYASALVARTLADPAIRRARTAATRGDGGRER